MQLESAGGMSADLFVRRKIKEVVAHQWHGTAAPEGTHLTTSNRK